jgi:hypothetical protein
MASKIKKTPKADQSTSKIAKMLKRLNKITSINRATVAVGRWASLMTDKDPHFSQVAPLTAALVTSENTRVKAIELLNALQTAGVFPPKKPSSGLAKLAVGQHVWIKPKFVPLYTELYDVSLLSSLYVLKLIEGRVVVSLGKPVESVQPFSFLVPKLHLQATAP